MKPEDIGKAYNQITHIWNSEEFDINNGISQHKKAISFVKSRGNALDVGCGCTGRFIDLLQGEGFTPSGLDISDEMLNIARKKHPDIRFVQGDICECELSEKYDFITAWDSIWHIPLSEQRNVLTKLVESLNVGGVLIFSFGGTDEEGFHTNNFMGPEVYYSSLGLNGFLKLFIELGCIIRHLEFDQHPELHTYLVVEKA
ncbi:MAG: class I SAM-dependent methyltransferase [Gammaproteobacteria bacterium]|uniref:class I SAM-dependent methyltransferase n=1 Tax=unclassified Marinomonas TaxID=196814 RepID=UPI000C1EE869|nr:MULTISPECIES: class I SAM-dependent methyltransferase [unclassified Marinomonas]MBU1293351.1 class I SAM-dependent methyltransferase [Gammaproteobacteria bacterium]MBU1468118.1 class I SAM-dependent methyltransferase [Gammaproteobacteria bacterium]MBU2238455.1 class I SAM-dependent methyltransferase [Gammaproteobacteria bacterium]MBU2316932.1 class I SAM-dependent methyltransferase [Gammaproteobacteria bacterium]MBU2412034.1 class I SAM-dependent methyltransferase [Gammaproteobacteria bacte